jgi:hypothetical protein
MHHVGNMILMGFTFLFCFAILHNVENIFGPMRFHLIQVSLYLYYWQQRLFIFLSYAQIFMFMLKFPSWRLPLWYSGQNSWLQIQRSGFDSRRYQIFWEVVGLERGPLSLVSTIEELFERKSSGSSLETWEYSCRDPSCWPLGMFCPLILH